MLQWIRHRLQVSLRQMEISGSGLEVHMAEQDLNGSQVCSCLEQVGRPTVAQGVRRYMLGDTGMDGGFFTGVPDGLVRDGPVGTAITWGGWGKGRFAASSSASTRAASPAEPD
jgi:hypothetical protein